MYAWKSGLKTGLYYLRTRPVAAAQKFTIEPGKKPDPVQKVLACFEIIQTVKHALHKIL